MISRKVELAIEVPTAHLDDFVDVVDWYFCIATECRKDEDYLMWHIHRPSRCKVMLDNGMFEEGKPMSVADLIHMTCLIQPQVVFAPDQVGDKNLTIEMTRDFVEAMKSYGPQDTRIGVIPQGKDAAEIADCYREMREEGLITNGPVGISFLNKRHEVQKEFDDRGYFTDQAWFHYLGLYNFHEITEWPETIRSMDTIKPIKAAMHQHLIEDCPRGLGKWNTRMTINKSDMDLAYRNIASMHKQLTWRVR